jgi:hypothetical protein
LTKKKKNKKGENMNLRLNRLSFLSILLIIPVFMFIAGCSSDSPFISNSDDQAGLAKSGLPEQAVNPLDIATAEAAISALSGGTIPINMGVFRHKFIVAPMGMNKNATIRIIATKARINNKPSSVFEFGPDGLVFNERSILDYDMAQINAAAKTANLYYYDPNVNEWILQETKDVENGRIKFSIYHFSKYAIN